MQHELKRLIAERVASGLKRKSVTTCSRWAEQYRVMGQPYPGPWTFRHHPWLRAMHDSTAEMNVGQKSAQMGYTEWALNTALFNIDVKRIDCLYVLPAKRPDASDFSSARFDAALELSPHLADLFSDTNNIDHKRAGTCNLYVRGSRARSGLKSVPAGILIFDELDEMTQENIPLALERASGQVEHMVLMLSTATIDNYGINAYYQQSSQNHFFFPCPLCSRPTELVFPDSLVVTATDLDDPRLKDTHLICKECKGVLPHETKPDWLGPGYWVETHAGRDVKGWHVNQLYSCTVRPDTIGRLYLQSLSDKAAEQEFYNSKLGVPHVVDGARVTDNQIDACKGDYGRYDGRGSGLITMGVDVGSWLHYEIDEWRLPPYGSGPDLNLLSQCRVVTFGKVRDFEELDNLMHMYGVHFCVIDAQPERRKAIEFANRFYGRVRVAWYPNGISGKTLHLNDDEQSVSVDRTSWLDLSLGRFRRGQPWLTIPKDIDIEYRTHMKALVRIYDRDRNDNPFGRYVKGSDADHFAHARNYSEIALPLAASLGSSSDITTAII